MIPLRQATVVMAEPLERGFGLTLGNALRRVLLSSRCKARPSPAFRSTMFCTNSPSVAGVREDVTDIVILNLKGVVPAHGSRRAKASVDHCQRSGCCHSRLTSADSAGIEILNKEHVICHLDDGADLYHGTDRQHWQRLCRLLTRTNLKMPQSV